MKEIEEEYRLKDWLRYLEYLDTGPHSIQITTSNMAPQKPLLHQEHTAISELNYSLWPFQKKILYEMENVDLILGLPTGLGKTYLAGARLQMESAKTPIRVLFLVPSIPLGIQQTLFAREKLGSHAVFVSGGIPPKMRETLKVWNNAFVVTTPQTFYNDHLVAYERYLKQARAVENPISYLQQVIPRFPFDIVVADECQRYIGMTAGYSILLSARACHAKILALSATPQLHASHRLKELRKVFHTIKTFSVSDPGITKHLPERLLVIEQLQPPTSLLKVYHALGKLVSLYHFRIAKIYGSKHPRICSRHALCRALLAIRMLQLRVVEDGASSVKDYETWKFRDLQNRRNNLDGNSVWNLYQIALQECNNHKLQAALHILRRERYHKAIVYVESVEPAKQLTTTLQAHNGVETAACLVGKGDMTMDQQASALLQFKETAKTLVCTSVGEEGLDIPSADLEIWIDPPSNPRKWIQRFGRILRQPGDKHLAKTIALINHNTHEHTRLLNVKKTVEHTYGFTQNVKTQVFQSISQSQRTITQYLRP
jgi:ERCC4-related helicase